jgi:hypothetical protein
MRVPITVYGAFRSLVLEYRSGNITESDIIDLLKQGVENGKRKA